MGGSAHSPQQFRCGCRFSQPQRFIGDLILVQEAWEGITFNRYYRGQAQWLSIPPIDSHEVHRIDLVIAEMNQPEAMTPALRAVTNILTSGHEV